jgi:hypothetical protein
MNGAKRIPDIAANEQPSIQARVVTQPELVPTSSVRSRSPTTARVCRPRCVCLKKNAKPTAAAMATATTTVWSMPTLTPGSRYVSRGKRPATGRRSPP